MLLSWPFVTFQSTDDSRELFPGAYPGQLSLQITGTFPHQEAMAFHSGTEGRLPASYELSLYIYIQNSSIKQQRRVFWFIPVYFLSSPKSDPVDFARAIPNQTEFSHHPE